MMKLKRSLLATAGAMTAVAFAILAPTTAQALGQYPTGSSGIDISYPSCSSPVPVADFGIVGVSGGRVYTDNACAAAEAGKVANASIYVNTGLVTTGNYFDQAMTYGNCSNKDRACGAYWYGYLAGLHAYRYAASVGLAGSPTWWLDVETTNTWNGKTDLNNASIRGEYDAIVKNAPAAVVGVYARPGQWSKITGGGLKSQAWPVWYATGLQNQTPTQLAQYCSQSFTSGPVYIVQWIGSGTLNDRDYAC